MKIISEEAKNRYNENRRIKRAKNCQIKAVCDECGHPIESPAVNRSYCFSCSAKRENESKQRWAERNPVKVRQIKDGSNRKKRERLAENAKTFTCCVCGLTSRKMGNETQCQGDCRRTTRANREKIRHIPKTQRNGTDMTCLLCGESITRSTHNKKYCVECQKRIASHRERRRALQKKSTGGTHTRLEFFDLCAAYLWGCAYCGKSLTIETATEDHVVPLSCGGSDDISNIAPACLSCNCSKGNTPVDVFTGNRRAKVAACC